MNKLDVLTIISGASFIAIVVFVLWYYYKVDKNYGRPIAIIFLMAFIGFVGTCSGPSNDKIRKIVRDEIKQTENEQNHTTNINNRFVDFITKVSSLQKVDVSMWITRDSINSPFYINYINIIPANSFVLGSEPEYDNHGNEYIGSISSKRNSDYRLYENNFKRINDSIYHFEYSISYRFNILNIYSDSDYITISKDININED